MRNTLMILNDYRNGTPEARLNLFLFHRDLRREFNEIEEVECTSLNVKKRGDSPVLRKKTTITSLFGMFKKKYQPAG
jgi:hypothetical protein